MLSSRVKYMRDAITEASNALQEYYSSNIHYFQSLSPTQNLEECEYILGEVNTLIERWDKYFRESNYLGFSDISDEITMVEPSVLSPEENGNPFVKLNSLVEILLIARNSIIAVLSGDHDQP